MWDPLIGYRDLFEYFKRERARLVEALEKLPAEELMKNRELSFNSIKDVLVHTVMAEDNWLHYRAKGIGQSTPRKFEDFRTLEDVKAYMAEVDRKTSEMLNSLSESDLNRRVRRVYPDGREEEYRLEEVLYHIPIEVIHHYGEIFAEFWKMNLEAPYYSYLEHAKRK